MTDVDPRVRVFDANFAAPGRWAGPAGAAEPGSELKAFMSSGSASAPVRLERRAPARRCPVLRRVLMRDSPPLVWFVVDKFALYRLVGSAEIMTVQMRQLSAVAAMPNVTLQVLPAIAHPATASGFVLADDSAHAEHVTSGYVITDETVSAVARMFDSLRAESYRASESLALIERVCSQWATGASPLAQAPTEGTA